MGLLPLLFINPVLFIILSFFLLYSIIAHEVAHGWTAHFFGDDTALDFGRLTLNPLAHLDPLGTIMLFLAGFGWAKPVPVNYHKLNTRFGLISVTLAGCATNILIAAISLFLLQFGSIGANPAFSAILSVTARINIMIGAFNLMPVPPLDGSKIVMSFLPREARQNFAKFEPYGFFILIILIFTGILDPVVVFMQNLIFAFIALLFRIF